MPSLADAVLPSFYAAASAEYRAAARREGVVERRLRFADRAVTLRFAGSGLADVLFAALAPRADDLPGDVDMTIASWEQRACPAGSLAFPWRLADVGPGGIVRDGGADRVLAVHDTYAGAVTLVDSSPGASVLHRVPSYGSIPWWERAAPLRQALFWALAGHRRHLVHAGAVGDDRGGVLLAGPRGSGKTTVVLAALAQGVGFVADDYVLLDARGEPEAVSLYGTASIAAASGGDEKRVVNVAEAMPGSLRASLPVCAVVVPRIRGGRTRLVRVRPAEALRAWAPTSLFGMPFDGGAALAALAAVVRAVPCFALEVGDDAAELARAVDQVLDQAAR